MWLPGFCRLVLMRRGASWVEFPQDLLAHVLEFINADDLLLGAMAVSVQWRHAAISSTTALQFCGLDGHRKPNPINDRLLILAARIKWPALRHLTMGDGIKSGVIFAAFCVPLAWSGFAATTKLVLHEWEHSNLLPMMIRSLPNLEFLEIQSDDTDSDNAPCSTKELCELTLPRVETLIIKHGSTWEADNVAAFIAACPRLQKLSLYGLDSACFNTTCPLTKTHLPCLTSLSLSNMGALTGEAVRGLVGKLPCLTHLVVTEWYDASMDGPSFDVEVEALLKLMLSCPLLRVIDYSKSHEEFSLEDLRCLGRALPNCIMIGSHEEMPLGSGHIGRNTVPRSLLEGILEVTAENVQSLTSRSLNAAEPVGPDLGAYGDVYKWSGGVLGADGHIYFVPGSANRILRFDPASNAAEPVGPDLGAYGDGNKWSGGVLGADGHIYFVPFDAHRILRFDPASNAAEPVGPDLGAYGDVYKWSGGVLGADGHIYISKNATKQASTRFCGSVRSEYTHLTRPHVRANERHAPCSMLGSERVVSSFGECPRLLRCTNKGPHVMRWGNLIFEH